MTSTATAGRTPDSTSDAPARAGLVLISLILGAFVCNVNLSVANVALPDIGRSFNASQTSLTLVAVGCTLGLAMSVLYFGAIGDRHGRKKMLLLGLVITVPAAFLSAFAPSVQLLMVGRLLTGLAAGMAYPTTLALITALWADGPKRTKSIALWQAVSGGAAVIGPALAGFLLESFWWGSVFLIVVPIAVLAFVMNFVFVPGHVEESTNPIDHLGGAISVLMIALVVLGLGMISAPNRLLASLVMLGVAAVLIVLFIVRQRRARYPLYDLHYAGRRLFWVPAVAGMIVMGSLAGAMYVGQQFLQNVMGYGTFSAGTAIIPAAVGMVLVAPHSAKFVDSRGARFTMLLGYCFVVPAFLVMLLTWHEGVNYLFIGSAYLLMGIGVGFALTPAARSLTSSVPVRKVGMASGTSDLQRDLGGSIFQAILGAVLTFGYASAFSKAVGSSPEASSISDQTKAQLTASFSSAAETAKQFPQYTDAIVAAAKQSFLDGANWAYGAGAIFVLAGATLVFFAYPKKDRADQLMAGYQKDDALPVGATAS